MPLDIYSPGVKPKPPDIFFYFRGVHRVARIRADAVVGVQPMYVLEQDEWVGGEIYCVVVRRGRIAQEGAAAIISPEINDLIISGSGMASRVLPSRPGAFRLPEVGEIDYRNFPPDGVLVRGANGGEKQVFMGVDAMRSYLDRAEKLLLRA